MRATEFITERKKKRKKSALRKYFFPGFAYYGFSGSESGDAGGDAGGESIHETAVSELAKELPSLKKHDYDTIDLLMRKISKKHHITGKALHDLFVKQYKATPDSWIKNKLDENPETYQNFSALYLSRLMTSYARWAYRHKIEEKPVEQKQIEAPKISDDEILQMSIDIYKKNKDWEHVFYGLRCFNILYKQNLITDFEGTLKRTEEAIKKKFLYASYKEKKEMNELLEDDEYMELACRRMAVAEYFDNLLKK